MYFLYHAVNLGIFFSSSQAIPDGLSIGVNVYTRRPHENIFFFVLPLLPDLGHAEQKSKPQWVSFELDKLHFLFIYLFSFSFTFGSTFWPISFLFCFGSRDGLWL